MGNPIELIKQLRAETGAGIQDCRKALEQAHSDYAAALALLHEQAVAAAAKRSERPAVQGALEVYTHAGGRIAVIVEVNTETDFASRSDTFRSFAHETALQIAAAAPLYVRDEDIPAEILTQQAAEAANQARLLGKPEAIIARIVEGTLKKFKDQKVLLRQPYIRDDTLTIAHLLSQTAAAVRENIVIRRFVRWELEEERE